ncbi:MAG: 30S ribosomal protein S9 [Proteobacteria bacterium]|nr:30S ribosomal protein S9 [Pseudomonadota bacterium]
MEEKRYCATGRRKNAVARLWLQEGKGKFVVNEMTLNEYFLRDTARMVIQQPLELTDTIGKFDIFVNVSGGGISGQAGAVKHGISRALIEFNPEYRSVLKKAGFLTRDSRVKERKKYGQRKARARFQFSKR